MIVTIVTPTLNAAEYLPQCIASVKQNAVPGAEIDHVVVDPGSTDATIAIAKTAGCRLIQGKDKGIFDAINKGSFQSRGDVLGFLGADDVMLPGAVAEIVKAFETSKARWAVGGIRWIDEQGASLGDLSAPPAWIAPRAYASLGWNPIMHMSTYIRRDLFEELGGFDITYRDAGDYELFMRALEKTPFVRIAKPLTCFRRTGANNSMVNEQRSRLESRAIAKRFGPGFAGERTIWRFAMRALINLRNPGWLAHKTKTAARAFFDPATPRYF
ncbi:glycosyltransferase family 2 protein [Fulvimarina sp. 2208YS6-2-32]|uniref:Glycosyltransferase family 2 protein n=1 Tax=Fulvimarina uroteuthidis TaxID=3098149 RepID=A0ABU5I088_9HYPH|nr:glycosyltransferase family 2 protein [Fulvimarina sp. 2208YS6-2-32]MDY8108795.1 glycosyltransferase family 2 protein [Fulvimarina sp. 2208YS6-2-32]